jgi:hypothetical protein
MRPRNGRRENQDTQLKSSSHLRSFGLKFLAQLSDHFQNVVDRRPRIESANAPISKLIWRVQRANAFSRKQRIRIHERKILREFEIKPF